MNEKELEQFRNYILLASDNFKRLRDDSAGGVIGHIISQPNFYLFYLTYHLLKHSKRLEFLTIALTFLTVILALLTLLLLLKKT